MLTRIRCVTTAGESGFSAPVTSWPRPEPCTIRAKMPLAEKLRAELHERGELNCLEVATEYRRLEGLIPEQRVADRDLHEVDQPRSALRIAIGFEDAL